MIHLPRRQPNNGLAKTTQCLQSHEEPCMGDFYDFLEARKPFLTNIQALKLPICPEQPQES